MRSDPTTWVVQEVVDLLDTASVGLYEFIWLLRGTYPEMSEAEIRVHADQALKRLQEEGAGRLVWLMWPEEDVVTGLPVVEPEFNDWRDPTSGEPYLAFSRN